MDVPYQVRVRRRSRYLSVCVRVSGITITVPSGVSSATVERFVEAKSPWIRRTLERFRSAAKKVSPAEILPYDRCKARARRLVRGRVKLYNLFFGFSVRRITVKDLRSRWGSCSDAGNLNFNYRVLFLPDHLLDYVVVHELCHIRHLDHSDGFWNLVASALPDYRERRQELRQYVWF